MSKDQKDKEERVSVFLVMLIFLGGIGIYGLLTSTRHDIPIFVGITAAFLFLIVMYVYLTREK
jgi:uncharacterized membrane protein YoaK (UPF0700 family)